MEESRLIQRVKSGDRRAFDDLYEKYKTMLFRSACLLLGNTQDAEDVLQETFLTAYLHINDLKNEQLFKPWIYRIMMRQIYRISEKKKQEFADDNIMERADSAETERQSRQDPGESLIRRMEIKTHLEKLPIRQREVLVLYYYNEMTIKEIAIVLQCMEGTVKSRLHTAKKNMRKAMQEEELPERNCEVVGHV